MKLTSCQTQIKRGLGRGQIFWGSGLFKFLNMNEIICILNNWCSRAVKVTWMKNKCVKIITQHGLDTKIHSTKKISGETKICFTHILTVCSVLSAVASDIFIFFFWDVPSDFNFFFFKKGIFLNFTQIVTVCGVPSAFPLGDALGLQTMFSKKRIR